MDYLPRIVDAQLDSRLGWSGAVLLEGPKACGKTSTARQRARSELRLDTDPLSRQLVLSDQDYLLDGDTPRLIDEWQVVPESWNLVRHAVDDREGTGQFILTGSATPSDDATRHSGAMRITRLRMHPMSLFESGDSTGAVSLCELFDGGKPRTVRSTATLADVAEALCRGGWPSNAGLPVAEAIRRNRDYIRTMASTEIVTVDGVRRDPRRVQALVFALARNSASYVTKKTLSEDAAGYGESLSPPTIDSYLDAMVRLWVAVPQEAWGERLRSAAQVRRTPKWHLADPSLAAAALGANPASLLTEAGAFGQLFESLAFRDLSVYAQACDAEVRAYQDNRDDEIDAVVVRDAEWAGFEIKLSSDPAVLDRAAAKLLKLAAAMRKQPKNLTIVTATGASFQRPDGVNVVAITTLGP